MDAGDLLARRIKAAIERRKVTQEAVAISAGISGGGLSDFLNRKPQKKTGKPSTLNVNSLNGIADTVGVPLWALLHEDEAIFKLFLQDEPRLAEAATKGPAEAMLLAMAVVSEARAAAAKAEEAQAAAKRKARAS